MEVCLPRCLKVKFIELSCRYHPTRNWLSFSGIPLAVLRGGAQPASDTHRRKIPEQQARWYRAVQRVKFALGWDWEDANQKFSPGEEHCPGLGLGYPPILSKTARNKQKQAIMQSVVSGIVQDITHIINMLALYSPMLLLISTLQVTEVRAKDRIKHTKSGPS